MHIFPARTVGGTHARSGREAHGAQGAHPRASAAHGGAAGLSQGRAQGGGFWQGVAHGLGAQGAAQGLGAQGAGGGAHGTGFGAHGAAQGCAHGLGAHGAAQGLGAQGAAHGFGAQGAAQGFGAHGAQEGRQEEQESHPFPSPAQGLSPRTMRPYVAQSSEDVHPVRSTANNAAGAIHLRMSPSHAACPRRRRDYPGRAGLSTLPAPTLSNRERRNEIVFASTNGRATTAV